uniref:CARD domain-containing protein n=1 Tax=Pygocentrus nattereri TaxID=42514 RepID=A0AAR2M1E7_PYGNA
MACSVQCAQDYVSDARVDLIEQLKNLPLIIEKLYQKKVLNNTEVSDLEAIPEKCRKARKVLDWITNKGKDACLEFLKILDLERKSVLPLKLHTWISHFSFGEESDDIQGPTSCHEIRTLLKTKAKEILDQQCKRSNHFFGGNAKQKFTYIPLVLDRDTEKNKPHNKVIHKSKKSKKPRGKKLRSYIPKDTCRNTPEDLLNSQEKSILLVGKPGIGKTTAVKQMLYFWAERHDENLDFMFYFDKNVLTNIATSNLQSLLLDTLIMSNADLRQKAEEITQYLEDYSEKVTIIFDGISGFHDNNILLRIIHHELLPEAKIVVTCRPETEDDDFFDWPTCKVYVQGFSEESIYTYLTQMPDQDPELVNSVVDNPALFSLCHVPMYAFMVAACFSYYTSEGAHKQCTATELYIRIFRHCIQRHGNKKLRHLDAHIKDCKDKILLLAESAFSATKLKTINLEFDYSDSCIAGVFLRSVSVVSPAFARTFCSFLHNTIQEFFSALWLLEKPQKLHEVLQLCQTEEYKHMKYMIPFLCGLLSETTIPLLKCLFPPDQPKGTCHGFFEKVLKTFLHDEPDEEYSVDAVFLCQCLNELQSSEACLWFLERVDYSLDLSEEHLDPHQCCAVSYVISQSRDKPVHLNLENSVVSLSGLKTILRHSQNLRDLSMTLCQVWTAALKCEQQSYLINLLLLCGKEIYLPIITQKALHQQAGEIITQSADPVILHLCCGQNPQQLSDAFCRTISTWLPSISSVHFTTKQNQRESCEEWEKRVTLFKLNLCLQAALHQKENVQTTVKKVTLCGTDECNFLLDLYSHVKQYETETGRKVLPALLPVYQSTRAEWIIDLSERKASLLLEVLKLQTVKKPVELSGWSDEESEVRSFLQCLPYISQLRLAGTKYIEFVVILFHEAAESERQTGQKTLELLTSMCIKSSFPCGDTNNHIQSAFLLDLYSHVKQYETETGRTVLPALLPVYQSVPAEWIIDLSERRTSLLLEVLKLQTVKKPVELRGWSDEENEVKRFFQCLPFISQLRFAGTKDIEFVVNLFRNAAQSERRIRLKTLELLMSVCSLPYGNRNSYIQSDFLLDLYSNVEQYETETGRNVLPALRPVYQSVPAEWIIDVSERRTSLLLEVLKLQTVKKPVELRGWSDEESEVRSFLLCLPFISQLRFNPRFVGERHIKFMVNLFHQAAESERQTGEKMLELLTSVCTYSSFPYGSTDSYRQSDFLLDLYSHVKQCETETGRNVLPALLPVYQSVPAEWIIHLSERNIQY